MQRDAQRRTRRVTGITLGMVTMVVTMAALLIVALNARSEAEMRQALMARLSGEAAAKARTIRAGILKDGRKS